MPVIVLFILRSVLAVLAVFGLLMVGYGGVRASQEGYAAIRDRDGLFILASAGMLLLCALGVAFFGLGLAAAFTAAA